MDFTVIVPFRDGHTALERLLDSLPPAQPVLVVDDMSELPYTTTRRNVQVLRLEQRGYFSGAVNAGLSATAGDVLILNQDTWFEGDRWRETLTAEAGLIGDGVFSHPAWPSGYVQGTFMFLHREAIERVGLLNARDFPLWGSTCEWQLRLCRAGGKALPLKQIPGLRHAERKRYGQAITRALQNEPDKRSWFIRTPPLISVVIPCYNYGRFLADAVNSLLGGKTVLGEVLPQTFQAFEVIIVDDASADDTPTVGAALADPWCGVRYLRLPENRGTPGALNVGITAAYGQYVTVLSADDMMQPDRLERLYRAAEEHPHQVICDDLLAFTGKGLAGRYYLPPYSPDGIAERNTMHAGILYRRAWWEEVGGYPEAMRYGREDWAFNVLLARCGHYGHMLDYAGYLYRRHGQNRSERNRGAIWRQRFREQIEYLMEENMVCCGQRKITAPVKVATGRSNGALPGADTGLVLLEYLGINHALVSWWGASGLRYEVSAAQRQFYVLPNDVEFFLQQHEGGKPAFRIKPRPDGGVTPEEVAAVNATPTAAAVATAETRPEGGVINLADGVNDAEAKLAGQAMAKRPRRRQPADAHA